MLQTLLRGQVPFHPLKLSGCWFLQLCFLQLCCTQQLWEYKSRLNLFNPRGNLGLCFRRVTLDFCALLAAGRHSSLAWYRMAVGRDI